MLCLYAIIQPNYFPMFIVTLFVFFYCCLSRLELLICCVNLFIRKYHRWTLKAGTSKKFSL
jgi:hypothetical protein